MDDSIFTELQQWIGERTKNIYEFVMAGRVDDLPPDDQPLARAISDHLHLKHLHNALEFADLRGGVTYEVEVDGHPVSPMAHLVMHSAVKGQVDADPRVRAAFDKLVAAGATPHQAEHVLAALFAELYFHYSQPGKTPAEAEKARAAYYRKIKKITTDAAYRKKLKRQFHDDHPGFG